MKLFDHSARYQRFCGKSIAFEFVKSSDIHDGVLFMEDISKTALRQTPVQRHLAAFKAAHFAVTRDGFRALCSAPRILAPAGSHALAEATFFVLLALGRPEIAQIHFVILKPGSPLLSRVSPLRSRVDAEPF